MQWHTPIIPTHRRLWQEDREFKANLCCIARLGSRKEHQKMKNK
jgi:hypothetical protein